MKLFRLIFLIIPRLFYAMDLPTDHAAHPRQDAIYSPTSKTIRLNLLNSLVHAVDQNMLLVSPQEFTQDWVTLAPKSFSKRARGTFVSHVESLAARKGVTSALVTKQMPKAQAEVAKTLAKRKKRSKRAAPDIKKDAAYIAQKFPGPKFEVQADPHKQDIYSVGHQVFYNEKEVADLADTPTKRQKVLSHERMHGLHNDGAVRAAYASAFAEQNKLDEYLSEICGPLFRTHEVFADVEPACSFPELAQAGIRLWERVVQLKGPGQPADHPAHSARLAYMHHIAAFHKRHEEEQRRKRVREIGARTAVLLALESEKKEEKTS